MIGRPEAHYRPMAHQLFTGCFAALEARWLAEVARWQREDPLTPVAVLVGSNLLASFLKGRLAGQGRAAANVNFYTFLDLATRLGEEPPSPARKPRLPLMGASAILEAILAGETPAVFNPVAGYRGFRDSLLDTFRDLRDAGVTPLQLEAGVRRCIREAPDRREHLAGLVQLYTRFRERVEWFRGVDDDFRAAIDSASRAGERLGCRRLLIYGIYDVTGQQADLLAGLKEALELLYFVPYVDEAVSSFARPLVQSCARDLSLQPEPLDAEMPAGALGRIWRSDIGYRMDLAGGEADASRDSQPPCDDGSVVLVSAPGESRAAIEIIREVLRAVRDGVISGFHEAAVVLRQPLADVPILAEAFRLRGIPYFIDGGSPFLERPLCRAVLAIAALEPGSYSRQAILTAMELLSASLPADAAASWDVPGWRALTNDARFLAGIEAWDAGSEALLHEAARDLRRAEEAASQQEDEAETPALSIPAARHKLESARALRLGWQRMRQAASGWPESLAWDEWAQFLEERLAPLLDASEDWAALSSALDGLALLAAAAERAGLDLRVSRARVTAALEDSLASLSHPEGRFQRRGVNLLSSGSARGLRFPLVIIPGLEEGRFPARLRQDPLLLDSEREQIGNPPRLALKSQRLDEEKLLFDMAARSAQRRLVFVTSRLDESSDRERIPSEFFLRAAAAARGSGVGLRDLAAGAIPGFRSVSLDNPAPEIGQVAVDAGEIRLRIVTAGPGSPGQALAVLAREEPLLMSGPLAYDRARWLPALTDFDGRIADPALVRLIAAKIGPAAGQDSASRLEELAKCPYLFFLRRVMGLEAWQEGEAREGLDPLERGKVVHRILESFLGDRTGGQFVAGSPEMLRRSLALQARAALNQNRPAGLPDLLWEIERDLLERLLQNWLAHECGRIDQGLVPSFFEHAFGEFPAQDPQPGLHVQAGKHLFQFRGRIDRIDLSPDGKRVRITDYKTGRLPRTMARAGRPLLMAGERIQIALYRAALSIMPGFEREEDVEAEYLHLQPHDGQIAPCSFDDGMLDEAWRRLPKILEILGDTLLRGVFFARTRGAVWPQGHCGYCDYLPVCGKDRVQREERKAGDPSVRHFAGISALDDAPEEEE